MVLITITRNYDTINRDDATANGILRPGSAEGEDYVYPTAVLKEIKSYIKLHIISTKGNN